MLQRPRPSSRALLAAFAVVATTGLGPASMSQAQPLTWKRWAMPYPRYDHVAVYDPQRTRMVVFGGVGPGPEGNSPEMWALRLDGTPRWEWLASYSAGTRGAAAVYDPGFDPPNGRMVTFGGEFDGRPQGGTLSLALATDTWSGGFTGSPPSQRYHHAAVFDGIRRRMLVFGGQFATYPDSVFQLDLATDVWSTLITTGALPSSDPLPYPVAHDVPRDRLIVRATSGTWELTLSGTPTWTQLVTSGTPPPDAEGDLFFDAPRDRMVQVQGDGTAWALSLGVTPTWTSIAIPPLPPVVHNAQIVHDPVSDRLIWFGSPNDTWAFDLASATWSLVEPGSPMPLRSWATTVAVPPWDAIVVYGGGQAGTYRFTKGGSGVFEAVTATGPAPSTRSGASGIYDPVRQRMIIFGGDSGALRNDVHALSIGPNPAWSPITPSGTPPPPRQRADAIYDPIRDRMVIFGGRAANPFNDVWALSLGDTPTWSQLSPNGALPEIFGQAVYDSRRDRLIAIGARNSPTSAWWMPLGGPATWTAFAFGSIEALYEWDAAYDSLGDRVLLYGGVSESAILRDVLYEMRAADGSWSPVYVGVGETPLPRHKHTLTRDPLRNWFVLYGGAEARRGFNDPTHAWSAPVWIAASSALVGVDPPPAAGAKLSFRRVWLASPDRIAFDLDVPGEGAVAVDVFDVTGRRLGVATLAATGVGARSGSVMLTATARSGVVLVRARQDSRVAVGRLAVLH